jgi:hypothetical protein
MILNGIQFLSEYPMLCQHCCVQVPPLSIHFVRSVVTVGTVMHSFSAFGPVRHITIIGLVHQLFQTLLLVFSFLGVTSPAAESTGETSDFLGDGRLFMERATYILASLKSFLSMQNGQLQGETKDLN